MFEEIARAASVAYACIDAEETRDWLYEAILYGIAEGITASDASGEYALALAGFKAEYEEYLKIRDIIKSQGGLEAMFDALAGAKDSVAAAVGSLGKGLSQRSRGLFRNKFVLNEHLDRTGASLTDTLCAGLRDGYRRTGMPVVILIDTYERLEGTLVDRNIRRSLARSLPDEAKFVVFGRNRLSRVSEEWSKFGTTLLEHPLAELSEKQAKSYLRRSGLREAGALQRVYGFTGGFPLILFDTVAVVKEQGGWGRVGTFDNDADHERVASLLLGRILREDAAVEVRAFLEKGVVLKWFNPELIGLVLDLPQAEANQVYEKLNKHSFIEYHSRGLCFQERIRTLLAERLRFVAPDTYNELENRVSDFLRKKAGLLPPQPG